MPKVPTEIILLGLHYGDLHSKQLELEVLRADVTKEKLEEMVKHFKVKLQVNTSDFSGNFKELEPVVEDDKIVFPMSEDPQSSFYISSVLVESNRKHTEFGRIVRSVFGPKALAVIASRSKN